MFWIFLMTLGMLLSFAKLGAMSVWLVVLKGALIATSLGMVALVAALLWKKILKDG